MLDWLLNIGTGLVGWVMFLKILIYILLGVWVLIAVYRLYVSLRDEDGLWKSYTKWLAFKSFVLAAFLFATLSAFGPGTPPQELPSDIGVMEYVDKAPDMKTPAEIQKEAEAKVDPLLKKQDEGFKAEQEEADAYLDEIKKKYQNQ